MQSLEAPFWVNSLLSNHTIDKDPKYFLEEREGEVLLHSYYREAHPTLYVSSLGRDGGKLPLGSRTRSQINYLQRVSVPHSSDREGKVGQSTESRKRAKHEKKTDKDRLKRL